MPYRARINGIEVEHKRRVALEIIKQYVISNTITIAELKEHFNNKHFSGVDVIMDEEDKNNFINERGEEEFITRYFTNNNDIIKINNDNIYISTQWGIRSNQPLGYFNSFIEYAKNNLTINIEVLNDNINSEINNIHNQIEFCNIKNIILYGAPGVGKTHNYQRIISMIENGNSEKDIFNTITNNQSNEKVELDNDIFQNIKNEKRVSFITFHQSYSYEDFIEGFRPNKTGNIELEDGIFKQMSYNSIFEQLNFSKESIKILDFDTVFDNLITDINDNNISELDLKDGQKVAIKKTRESKKTTTISLKHINGAREYIVSKLRLKKLFEEFNTKTKFNQITNLHNEIRNIIGGCNTSVYWAVLNHILKSIDEIEIDELTYEDLEYTEKTKLVQEYIKSNSTATLKEKSKNFYLVIDEINRGNISKIFGELITLIEEDKRDKYEVTLPYSKEPFKVPSNLYIIATMNSTDKSIATIDIALRRRFTFLKMKPNENLVVYKKAKNLMHELNTFIKDNLGEDYMLGHSYFMGTDIDLEFIIEYKLKPLLEEYFYADDEKLKEILKLIESYND